MHAPRHRIVQAGIAKWLCAASLAVVLVLCTTLKADAGAVYGRVTAGGQPVASQDITITSIASGATIRVRTDEAGNYAAVLAQGTYTVRWGGREAIIRSPLGRARQDVHF